MSSGMKGPPIAKYRNLCVKTEIVSIKGPRTTVMDIGLKPLCRATGGPLSLFLSGSSLFWPFGTIDDVALEEGLYIFQMVTRCQIRPRHSAQSLHPSRPLLQMVWQSSGTISRVSPVYQCHYLGQEGELRRLLSKTMRRLTRKRVARYTRVKRMPCNYVQA